MNFRILSGFVNLPAVLLFYLMMAVCIVPEQHGVPVVFGLPGDFAQGGLDTLVFGKWMLLLCVPVLVDGIVLERGRQIEIFSKLRMKNRQDFTRAIWLACMAMSLIWSSFLTIGTALEFGIGKALALFPLLASNLYFWTALQVTLYVYSRKASWIGWAPVLLSGVSCLGSLYVPGVFWGMPSVWGMLCGSSLWREGIYCPMSYPVMILLNLMAGAVCLWLANKREE